MKPWAYVQTRLHFYIVGLNELGALKIHHVFKRLTPPSRKEPLMISSPCKDCQKRNFPKDECLKTCQMIQNIQGMQLARRESNVYSAVDFSEESRFQIASPFASALNIC
jgi:hypothetical protein